jgi:hypothetical protein
VSTRSGTVQCRCSFFELRSYGVRQRPLDVLVTSRRATGQPGVAAAYTVALVGDILGEAS